MAGSKATRSSTASEASIAITDVAWLTTGRPNITPTIANINLKSNSLKQTEPSLSATATKVKENGDTSDYIPNSYGVT